MKRIWSSVRERPLDKENIELQSYIILLRKSRYKRAVSEQKWTKLCERLKRSKGRCWLATCFNGSSTMFCENPSSAKNCVLHAEELGESIAVLHVLDKLLSCERSQLCVRCIVLSFVPVRHISIKSVSWNILWRIVLKNQERQRDPQSVNELSTFA